MNNFSNEQANIIMNHIEFMMNTNRFDFVMYFLSKGYICSDITDIPHYAFNSKKYNKYIKFNTFNQIKTFIDLYFKNNTEFCNTCFAIKSGYATTEGTWVSDSEDFLKKEFGDKLEYGFFELLHKIMHDQHLIICNFTFKNKEDSDIICRKDNNFHFYDENLDEAEREYFKQQYYIYNIMYNPQLKAEKNFNNDLINYRHEFGTFEHAHANMIQFEQHINSYVMSKLENTDIIKFGPNHKYENTLKEIMIKLINNFENKKVKFWHDNNDYNIQFRYAPETFGQYRAEATDTKVRNIILKLIPGITKNMFDRYYVCIVTIPFQDEVSMQIKKTLTKKLNNYLINNNINPISYKIMSDGLSKPGIGIELSFICNSYEDIGINPIKFLIPKLSMHA